MSIYQGVANSFRLEVLQGVHDLSTDVLKIALYDESAAINPSTTAYTATGEVVGDGYTAGGAVVPVSLVQTGYTVEAVLSSVEWPASTFSAGGALVYNSSKSDKAILVLNFGGSRSVSGASFAVNFPSAGSDYPVLKLGN